MVPTKRSAMAFARGARTSVLRIWMSIAANTASKAAMRFCRGRDEEPGQQPVGVVEVHDDQPRDFRTS